MFLVGLTGGIATGKSTVSRYFLDLGCVVLDADKIAREVVEPGTRAWKKIRTAFGEEVFLQDGELNRRKLGEIIFADAEKRRLLNSITHPEIYRSMLWRVVRLFLSGQSYVVLDLPLLYESGHMLPYLAYTVVVTCSEDEQMHRLIKRNKLTESEARLRIDAQASLDEKRRRATHVIDNDKSREATRQQVEALCREFRSSWTAWRNRLLFLSAFGLLSILTIFIGRQLSGIIW